MGQVIRRTSCACGGVTCEGVGQPILSAVCYCQDCQEGGRRIESLPGAEPVLDPDGGTSYLTYREDRFRCVTGSNLLVGYRIKDRAPTRRMVASCCNSAMFLKFEPGFWISAYRRQFEGDLPAIELRNQTKHRVAASKLPDDAPSYRGYPARLIFRLLAARAAMLIGP